MQLWDVGKSNRSDDDDYVDDMEQTKMFNLINLFRIFVIIKWIWCTVFFLYLICSFCSTFSKHSVRWAFYFLFWQTEHSFCYHACPFVSNSAKHWTNIQSYYSNLTCTPILSHLSTCFLYLSYDAPQGSILGPILLSFYNTILVLNMLNNCYVNDAQL